MPRISFTKTYYDPASILALLKSRGMVINDEHKAETCIKNISYYRLSAYCYPFLQEPKKDHRYKPGTTFEKVMALYHFDEELRQLMFLELGRIEVAIRSAIANITAEESGNPFWMTEASSYANSEKFAKTMALIDKEYQRSKEVFVQHFKATYTEPYPPAWQLIEILPLGVVTRIYENIASNKARKRIAQYFNLNIPVFSSWVTMLTFIRNSCCHFARIWNKENAIRPLKLRHSTLPWINPDINPLRTFFDLSIMKWFIDIVKPDNKMKENLVALLTKYPMINPLAMGFPASGWEDEPLWK